MFLFGALVLGENVGIHRLYIIPIKQSSDPTQELTDSLFSQVLEYIFKFSCHKTSRLFLFGASNPVYSQLKLNV